MTTTVTIRHDGPPTHDVLVEVIAESTGNVIQGHVLKDGENTTLYVYKQQSLKISEHDKS